MEGIVKLKFNLISGNYKEFIKHFCRKLAEHEFPEEVAGHHVLAKQQYGRRPNRWMYIKLVGKDEKGMFETTLAVRDDYVYLIGFQGEGGRWYEFIWENQIKESHINLKLRTVIAHICTITHICAISPLCAIAYEKNPTTNHLKLRVDAKPPRSM
jgi:hypothetical protein